MNKYLLTLLLTLAAQTLGAKRRQLLFRVILPASVADLYQDQRVLSADLVQWAPAEMLMPPKMEARRQPMAFNYPGIVRHVIRLQLPEDVYRQPAQRQFDEGDSHFRLTVQSDLSPNEIVATAEARITTDQVAAALKSENQELPLGAIRSREQEQVVQINARLKTPADFRDIVVARRNGTSGAGPWKKS